MVTLIIDYNFEGFLKQLKDNFDIEVTSLELQMLIKEREDSNFNKYMSFYSLNSKYFYAFYDDEKKELMDLPHIFTSENKQSENKKINYFPCQAYLAIDKTVPYLVDNIIEIRNNYDLKYINSVNGSVSLLLRYIFNLEELNERSGSYISKRMDYDFSYLRREDEIGRYIISGYGMNVYRTLFSSNNLIAYFNDIINDVENNFLFHRDTNKYEFIINFLTDIATIEGEDYLPDDFFCSLIDRLYKAVGYYKENSAYFNFSCMNPPIQSCYSDIKKGKYINFLFDVALLSNSKHNNQVALINLSGITDYLEYSKIEKLPSFKKFKNNMSKYIMKNKNSRTLKLVYDSIPNLIDWSKEDTNLLREAFPNGMEFGDFKFNPVKKEISIENYPSTLMSHYPSVSDLVLAFSFILYSDSDEYIDEMAVGLFNQLNQGSYSKDIRNAFKDALFIITGRNKYEIKSDKFDKFINKLFEKVDSINSVTDYRKYLDFAKSCEIISKINTTNRSDKFKSVLMEYKLKK